MNCPNPLVSEADVPPSRDLWLALLPQLQEALAKQVPASVAIYELPDQTVLQSGMSVASLLGYTPEEMTTLEPWGLGSLIHPDDLHRVAEYYQRLMTLRLGEAVGIDYRMRRADGSWCWLRSQETPLFTPKAGYPLQILGIVQDMTQGTPPSLQALTLAISGKN